jgi:flagellar hook-length control protein FliK
MKTLALHRAAELAAPVEARAPASAEATPDAGQPQAVTFGPVKAATARPRFELPAADGADPTEAALPPTAHLSSEDGAPDPAPQGSGWPTQDPAQLLACLAQAGLPAPLAGAASGPHSQARGVDAGLDESPAAPSAASGYPSAQAGPVRDEVPLLLPSDLARLSAAIGAEIGVAASKAEPAPTAPPAPSEKLSLPASAAREVAAAAPAPVLAPAAPDFAPVLAALAPDAAPAGSEAQPPLQLGTGTPDSWQQPLLQALGDRLQVQIAARSDQAVLHLAPPQLGRVEIAIRQQGGAVQVQMSATHEEVTNQLRQISEPLRHELVQRHAGEVSVQVSAGGSAGAEGRGREGGQGGAGAQSQAEAREQQSRARHPARARDDQDETAGSFAQRLHERMTTA